MSDHHDETARPPADARRKLLVAGVAGLAVVVGGGAYLMANRDSGADPRDNSAVAPLVVPSSADVHPGEVASAATTSPGTVSAAPSTPAATGTPKSKPRTKPTDEASVRKEIEAARAKAAREGYPLQRPLEPEEVPLHDAGTLQEQTLNLPDGGTQRIISAKYDLSKQREMLWAADAGQPVDDAHCTQNFRFAQNAKPAVRPTMMLCWRNTATRSVVVLTVLKKGTPSPKAGAAAIAERWANLG